MMTTVAAVAAISAFRPATLILIDPYQAYKLDCTLYRPHGQSLKIHAKIFGRTDETRRATIEGSDRRLPYGQNLSVYRAKPERPEAPLDFETISFSRNGSDFRYIVDESMPSEEGFVRMTVLEMKWTDSKPVQLSAIGFCKKTDFDESETVQ